LNLQEPNKMSISSVLYRLCNQTALYWGNPQDNGYGGRVYDYPIEIKCRWQNVDLTVATATEGAIHSQSIIYVLQDLDEEGYLMLGTLNDIDSDQALNPIILPNVEKIRRFDKSPDMNAGAFVRKAYTT
jgi:hypothetical protein